MAYNISLDELVYSWLEQKKSLGKKPNLFLRRQLTLSSSADAANVEGLFLGEDTSDPNASGEEIYSDPKNLPTAIASILGHIQNYVGYHPATDTNQEVADSLRDYVNAVRNTPFFCLEYVYCITYQFEDDYYDLGDIILQAYQHISPPNEPFSPNDLEMIEDSLERLAKSVFITDSQAWYNVFLETTIDANTTDIHMKPYLYLMSFRASMTHSGSGKHEISTQVFTICIKRFLIIDSLIQSYAHELATLDKYLINQWIQASSTPQQENAKLCFERKRKGNR